MSTFLLFLVFTMVFIPCVEGVHGFLWHRWTYSNSDPRIRIRRISLHMLAGILGGGFLATFALFQVRMSEASTPLFAEFFLRCLGHGADHGPGLWTVLFLLTSGSLLTLATVALFYPLPSAPEGTRRPDLEQILAEVGIVARVETVPGDEPACFSEIVPYPRVLLHGGIEETLQREQMESILLHEAGHLSLGDHRTRIWARAYRRLMFFFPGGDRLHQDLIHEQERRADDQVLKWRPGLRDSLRGTLHHLALQEGPFLEEATSSSMALGVLGQEAWSVKQRISVLQGKQEDSPDYVLYLRWCLPGIGLLFLMILGETGPCTLHCVLAALP